MDSLFQLHNEIAVVTGVLGNLGPIFAETLLEAGATVIGIDLENKQIPETFSSLQKKFNKKLFLLRADILKREDLLRIQEQCLKEIGSPSILINNAGIDQPPSFTSTYSLEEIPFDLCHKILEVNLLGAFQAIQIFGSGMAAKKYGSIINIGSLYASVSPDERFYDHIPCEPKFLKPPIYGASKAALINLTRYFAAHWGPMGVRVNTLSPGGVLGLQDEEFKRKFCDRVPMGRMAEKKDLKGPLLFLASPLASSYVTGIELKVDGGYTVW